MGVLGLTTLLQQHGWMPKNQGCKTRLWRDDGKLDNNHSNQIQLIPAYSTLAIDGNGLAHFLHAVAYSRYYDQVTGGGGGGSDCSCKQELSPQSVTACLPQSMPLAMLNQVTREFVDSLQKNSLTLHIYWDGRGRRMKAATAKKRRGVRDDEWSNLYQYCHIGVLPFRSPCLNNFAKSFPISRLFMAQVYSTLSSYADVEHVHCDEEADRQVAMASAFSEGVFSVGMDSDYCLFPNTKYVPLSSLDASSGGSHVTGSVITRDGLADLFHLPSSESMVELGILMGNDYIGHAKEAYLDYSAPTAEDAIEHLQQRGNDYHVSSSSDEVQLAIDFTRALYGFHPLDDFPMDSESRDVEDSDSEEDDDDDDTTGDRPSLPFGLDLSLTTLEKLDFSLMATVTRAIQDYVDQSTETSPMITQEQLDTFQELSQALELKLDKRTGMTQRPTWEGIRAAYLIEKTISYALHVNAGSPAARYTSPMKLFDYLSFENMMNAKQIKEVVEAPPAPEEVKDTTATVARPRLPIDEFEQEILHSISTQRVTIIHGETGCGKSSRVPVMVMRNALPDNKLRDVKMFISQPRRIAAKSLVERVRSTEPDIRHKIALRMGHGEREYESKETRAWFVTTGYLVRLLANMPERFNDVSHLIIDEVHERSVDSDVLCLLCKRLLETNSTIRLVLMSATLAANMYADYFGVSEPPISVGGRRFPIKEFFIEDIQKQFKFAPGDQKRAKQILDQCEKTKCRAAPSNTYMENLYQIAVRVTTAVGKPGSSVLIFVTGMNDIISIIDLIEKQYVPGVRYTCFPIHSDVPFEEQMAAFDKPAKDEIKVIIGTNAAESSITLPDVDHVVCLGLQKQIIYNPASHRQLLTPAWISKANAVQRAGRTGRVRNGNVYRLYTRRAFDQFMYKFEIGEMSRVPLDSVILDLKEMLHEQATPVLLDCLEPPELLTIERSFESLHKQNFLSSPDDDGGITMLGSFVSSLGIDLMLGSLIGLGIQFGIGAEAIELAAILSFAKTPWMISNPMFHDAPKFNDLTSKTFSSRCHFDANLYSDPLATMNMLWDYENIGNRKQFAWKFNLASSRVRRLLSTRNSIRSRVAEFIGTDVDNVSVQEPPSQMPHAKLVLLRIIQVWVLHDNLVQAYQVSGAGSGDSVGVTLRKNVIDSEQLKQILDEKRHEFKLVTHREFEQKGNFTPVDEEFDFHSSFLDSFEERYLSYCAENAFNMAWYKVDNDRLILFATEEVAASGSIAQMKKDVLADVDDSSIVLEQNTDGNLRGRKERSCGLWTVAGDGESMTTNGGSVRFVRFAIKTGGQVSKLAKYLKIKSLQTAHCDKTLSCQFFVQQGGKKKKKKKSAVSLGFSLFIRGQGSQMSKQDVVDLFSTTSSNLEMTFRETGKPTQEVQFKIKANAPLPYGGKNNGNLSGSTTGSSSSWKQPLLNDIPEGARIMSVIASSRRPEHYILFEPPEQKGKHADEKPIKVEMSRTESRIPDRWFSFHSARPVYVEVNSIPAAALSMESPTEIFAIAGDALELKGGSLRVSGLTLMPPGRLFLLLAMKTFGLNPLSTSYADEDQELEQCFGFLSGGGIDYEGNDGEGGDDEVDVADRVLRAIEFNDTCRSLGEELTCYPALVEKLLSIFDDVDGYRCLPWESLYVQSGGSQAGYRKQSSRQTKSRKVTPSADRPPAQRVQNHSPPNSETNNSKKKKPKKKNGKQPGAGATNSTQPSTSENQDKPELISPEQPQTASPSASGDNKKKAIKAELLTQFSKKARKVTKPLFATSLDGNVEKSDLPSTNILSMLVDTFRQNSKPSEAAAAPPTVEGVPAQWAQWTQLAVTTVERQDEPVAFVPSQWQVYRVTGRNSKIWFSASFIGSTIGLLPLDGRKNVPVWMRNDPPRPTKNKDALQCVPPHVAPRLTYWQAKVDVEGEEVQMVLFPTLELALRMGAAYWMERQFSGEHGHWYQVGFDKLMELASSGR